MLLFLWISDRVLTKPVIQGPVNQTVTYMDDVRFDCIVVMSDLQPHIQWLKHYEVNGSYINEDDEPYVHIIQVFLQSFTLFSFFFKFFIVKILFFYTVSSTLLFFNAQTHHVFNVCNRYDSDL